jgi:nitroreductase
MKNTSFYHTLKKIKKFIVIYFNYILDAIYDTVQFYKYSNSLFKSPNDLKKTEALIFYYYHKIEKALALPNVKPLFGLDYIHTLIDLMDQWVNLGGDTSVVVFRGGYESLSIYKDHVNNDLKNKDKVLHDKLDEFLSRHSVINSHKKNAGILIKKNTELNCPNSWKNFTALANSRCSIRMFSDRQVDISTLREVVKLAQRTPSVCNRQSWRVHIYSRVEDKQKILRYQNGNTGFGIDASKIILITSDVRAFVNSSERNQSYIDGGLYSMSLMYALQAKGLVYCPLNLASSHSTDRKIHRAMNIPKSEVLIMLLAVGFPQNTVKTAVSSRMDVDDMMKIY